MFFGRGVLEVVGLFYHGPLEVGGESRALVFQTVRFFWALCSLATVILVFGIGRRFWVIGVRRLGRFVCGLGTHHTTAGAFFYGRWPVHAIGRGVGAGFKRPDMWLAALVTLLLLQPYLVTQPEIMQRTGFSDDFGYSLQVARGEVLRPWSMVDMHTVSFLHYWTDMWPQAVGWPLTIFFAVGFA
jgi:hypothetical protein